MEDIWYSGSGGHFMPQQHGSRWISCMLTSDENVMNKNGEPHCKKDLFGVFPLDIHQKYKIEVEYNSCTVKIDIVIHTFFYIRNSVFNPL